MSELILVAGPPPVENPHWLDVYQALARLEHSDPLNPDGDEVARRRRWMLFRRPYIFVGEVDWIRAILTGDHVRYVPGPVAGVVRAVGVGFVLTPARARAIVTAMSAPNRSVYGRTQADYTVRVRGARPVRTVPGLNSFCSGVIPRRALKQWLSQYMGLPLVQETR